MIPQRLLIERLEALAQLCGGGVGVSATRVEVEGGEAIELAVQACTIRVSFGDWVERFGWDPDDADASKEAAELALDFVAAALFGELRIIERRRHDQVLARALEVCVAGSWREHATLGGLGLAGGIAMMLGRIERRVRSNEGRQRRPKRLRDAGPSGMPSAPWAGAARVGGGQGEEIAIDGELDLHNFSPKEVAPLVREYIEVCVARGIRDLRIVHGKGKGVLRRTVHSQLAKHEAVESYRLGGHGEGSWGATIVRLR